MKKSGFFVFLCLILTIKVFSQENNYLINDIANLIGLESNTAINSMKEIYEESFYMQYEINISDENIIFKPVLDTNAFMGMGISMYIIMPNIILTKNNEGTVISVSSENKIYFDISKLDVIDELDENTIKQAELTLSSFHNHSKSMIEDSELFNIFVNINLINIPIKPESIAINNSDTESTVKYIWIGNNELHGYIKRSDINKIEYGFEFKEEYMKTFSGWYKTN